ncbi:MAG: hypothetical protein ACLTER_24435 [Ruminococcus sp.]
MLRRDRQRQFCFNIDIEGFSNKDKTAVLRVFAKMFYNHLGFYGENLKVAMMERYIDQQGKRRSSAEFLKKRKANPGWKCAVPLLSMESSLSRR